MKYFDPGECSTPFRLIDWPAAPYAREGLKQIVTDNAIYRYLTGNCAATSRCEGCYAIVSARTRTDCTKLLLKYRDITRMIWNAAFWPNDLQDETCFVAADYTAAFDETVARLYEGMILLPLGNSSRVEDANFPGKTAPLSIEIRSSDVECLIDENLPSDPIHGWRRAGLSFDEGGYEFEFRNFFDWDQLGHRDFLYVEVLIRRLDARPEAVGHHALISVADCRAWAVTAIM